MPGGGRISIGGGSGCKPPEVVAGVFGRAAGGAGGGAEGDGAGGSEGDAASGAGRRAAAAGFGLRRGNGMSGINSDGGMT